MAEHVGVFDELGADCIDGQLKFTQVLFIEEDIDEDILGALLQSVLDSYHLHQFRLSLRKRLHFLKNLEDLALLGGTLAPHDVTDLEGDEVGRRSPSCLAGKFGLIKRLGDCEETVHKTVEVESDV